MIYYLLFILAAIFLIINLLQKKKTASILCGAAALLVCGIIRLSFHIASKGYTYEPNIDIAKLETFRIDLDTAEQYEEWFCPNERTETDEYILMSRMISFEDEPYRHADVSLFWYPDEQAAIERFEHYFHLENEAYAVKMHTSKKLDANYDYYFSKIYSVDIEDYFFLVLPSSYSFDAGIRYKNVIFTFWESYYRRESRLDEMIDRLLAAYEQYKNENGL